MLIICLFSFERLIKNFLDDNLNEKTKQAVLKWLHSIYDEDVKFFTYQRCENSMTSRNTPKIVFENEKIVKRHWEVLNDLGSTK